MSPHIVVLVSLQRAGDMTVTELVAHTALTKNQVWAALRRLRENKQVFILTYNRQPDGVAGRATPVYRAGRNYDAKEPARLSRKETNESYRRRHKAVITTQARVRRKSIVSMWDGLGQRPERAPLE